MNFKIGDIITRKNDSKERPAKIVDITDDYYIINYLSQSDQSFVAKPKAEFEKRYALPEYERWRADNGDKYWTINTNGVSTDREEGHSIDNRRYAIGNYFKTMGEAELYEKKLIAYQTIKDDAKGFEPDWKDGKQSKWYVEYDSYDKRMKLDWIVWKARNDIYFATEKDAHESLKKHEAEWKLLLGVED